MNWAWRTHNLEQVETAIGYGRWAVSTLDPGHPLRPDAFVDLADALHARYELTKDVNTLNEAITVGRQALDLIPVRHPSRASAPYEVGQYLEEMYRRTQDPRALDDAVVIARWGVQVSYSDPHHADHLRLLANLLQVVYQDRGDLGALQEAVHLLRTAASQLPREIRNGALILMSLGKALTSLGGLADDAGVTREAVHWLRQALATCGDDNVLVAAAAYDLMVALTSLHMQTGEPDALREAVQHGRRSLAATPHTSAARGIRAGDLAAAVSTLSAISGDDAGALRDEAKELFREAVSSTTGETQTTYRYGLWSKLWAEYHENDALPLLREAAEHIRAVAAAADPAGDLYGSAQQGLGITLLALFERDHAEATLDEAIDAFWNKVSASGDLPALA